MLDVDLQKSKHLSNRAGFGLTPVIEKVTTKTFFVKGDTSPLDIIPRPEVPDNLPPAERKQRAKEALAKSRDSMMKLNIAWMERLRTSNDPLREKMILFWHNHFACRTQQPYLAQNQNNLLRKYALGNFADMLMDISKDPAMLQFLNNQQNKKGHPNENFAREVMELFTLGRGHYSENDIKEAARAFTGWGFNPKGEFVFREKQHDDNDKSFRGKTKNFSGEDIIDAILDDAQTAKFITAKLTAYLVSPSIPQDQVDDLSNFFFKSGYDIGKLVRNIFSADWFYKKEFIGNRIKTPVELIVGVQHQTNSHFADPQSLIFFQRALGQQLFYPPNVGGWPKGKEWIDSSSLSFRMMMPQMIFHKQETEFQAKDDGDVNSLREKKPKRDFSLDVNWENLAKTFSGKPEDVYAKAEDYLLSRGTSTQNKNLILKFATGAKGEGDLVKKIFTGIMSLPEYQLC